MDASPHMVSRSVLSNRLRKGGSADAASRNRERISVASDNARINHPIPILDRRVVSGTFQLPLWSDCFSNGDCESSRECARVVSADRDERGENVQTLQSLSISPVPWHNGGRGPTLILSRRASGSPCPCCCACYTLSRPKSTPFQSVGRDFVLLNESY